MHKTIEAINRQLAINKVALLSEITETDMTSLSFVSACLVHDGHNVAGG